MSNCKTCKHIKTCVADCDGEEYEAKEVDIFERADEEYERRRDEGAK